MTTVYCQEYISNIFQNDNSFADFSADQVNAVWPIKGAINSNSREFTSFNHINLTTINQNIRNNI